MKSASFQCLKQFSAKKAKFLGLLPGYDEKWMRNVELSFHKAAIGSVEYNITPWWLGITAEGEKRMEMVPFKVLASKKMILSPESEILQVFLEGKSDLRGSHISDLKVQDTEQLRKQMFEWITRHIIEGRETGSGVSFMERSSTPSIRLNSPQLVVGFEDKENMSGSSSSATTANARNRSFGKQSLSGGVGGGSGSSASGLSGVSFYGAQPRSSYTSTNASLFAPSPKPTSSLTVLRNTSTSPSPGVGSQKRPIPTMKVPNAAAFTPYGQRRGLSSEPSRPTNPFGSYSSKGPSLPSHSPPTCRTSPIFPSVDSYNFENSENDPENTNAAVPMSPLGWTPVTSTSIGQIRSPTSPSSPIGLLNLGNSCYMNAVLQSLFAQPSFNYDLSRINVEEVLTVMSAHLGEIPTSSESTLSLPSTAANSLRPTAPSPAEASSLVLCVLNLLRSCGRTPPESIERQKARLLAVKTASKKFTDSQQHDAQEFLCCILDDLKEEHRRCFTAMKGALSTLSESEISDAESLANPVSANFDFTLRKSLSCRHCSRVASQQVESFNNLSVHIPNAEVTAAAMQSREPKISDSGFKDDLYSDLPPLTSSENAAPLSFSPTELSPASRQCPDISLQDCIDNFFQKEEIEYRPEQCGHDSGGVVSYCLASLPRVFVIHLKRFLYTVTSNVGTKCTQPVTIPLELDLSKYCADTVHLPKLVDNPLTPKAKEALKSEILSPAKLSPPPVAVTTPLNGSKSIGSRKRMLNFDHDENARDKNDIFGDENVPMSSPPGPKRCRSTTNDDDRGMSVSSTSSLASSSSIEDTSPDVVEFKRQTKYRLSAIISHTGSSSDYGHYTTDAYHSTLKRWFRFDDMAVKGISETNVLEENKWNGYIFFYTASPVWDQADALLSSPKKGL